MSKWRSVGYIAVLFAVFIILELSAHADLFNRGTDINGNRLIYDSDLNITWYDYSNYGVWQDQKNWASALMVNLDGNIYSDWRLWTAINQDGSGPCSGFYCTTSEMGHLFYTELGNSNRLINFGPFQKLNNWAFYWSGTEDSVLSDYAWGFGTDYGGQGTDSKFNGRFALAVRDGDVAVAPEPTSTMLFFTAGTLLVSRKYIRRMNERGHR